MNADKGRIFQASEGAIEQFDTLQSLTTLLRSIIGLRDSVVISMQAYWLQEAAVALALAAAEQAQRNFGSFDWDDQ
ncbi:hypothetical protein LTR22_028049, partial [Elasticomyces elasticus]